MEVHSFYCDVCNREFSESQLACIDLPAWNAGEAKARFYNDTSMARTSVGLKRLDICDECLIAVTAIREVEAEGSSFLKVEDCPDDAEVRVKKFTSGEMTTRHGKVVKK